MSPASWVASVTLGWAALVSIITLEAIRRSVQRGSRPALSAPRGMKAALIRPVTGADPWLEENLVSAARARRSFATSITIAIPREDDPAATAAHAAAQRLRDEGLDACVIVTRATAKNGKVGQLAVAVEQRAMGAEVVIVVDADVDLTGFDLDALVAPLSKVACAWAPFTETQSARTTGDSASMGVLGASLHAFPVLSRLDGASLVGKTFAIRSDALATIGGFDALADALGEDVMLARQLAQHGLRVTAVDGIARARVTGRTFAQSRARFARWLTVVRAQRPALLLSYPLLFLATAPILISAMVAIALNSRLDLALGAIVLSLTSRVAVALTARRCREREGLSSLAREVVLADLVLWLALYDALAQSTVTWRGRALRVEGGRITEATHDAA